MRLFCFVVGGVFVVEIGWGFDVVGGVILVLVIVCRLIIWVFGG